MLKSKNLRKISRNLEVDRNYIKPQKKNICQVFEMINSNRFLNVMNFYIATIT